MKQIKSRTIVLMSLMSVLSPSLYAQKVVIDAELRPRVEYRDGYSKPLTTADDPGIFGIQRTRVGMGYTSGLLTTQITFQDSRAFGQYATNAKSASVGLFEAWAEMLVCSGGVVKLGRQALNFDDGRLFSASAWSNSGTVHDLALFKYTLNDWEFQVAAAYNNNEEIKSETYYTPASAYRYLGLLRLSKPLFEGGTLTAMLVDEGIQDTVAVGTAYHKKITMNHGLTYGGNLVYSNKALKLDALLTAYGQAGHNYKGETMNGYLIAANATYSIMPLLSAKIGLDLLSGDASKTDGKQSNFKKLYGANHKFNGSMDYWNTPLTEGLLDYYGNLTLKPSKSFNFDGAFHLFSTDKSIVKNGTTVGSDLGSEIDLTLKYKMNQAVQLEAGWSTYFTTDTYKTAKNLSGTQKMPQWAYVMLTIKPTLFKTAD